MLPLEKIPKRTLRTLGELISSPNWLGLMGNLATELSHLKSHVKYPANRAQVVAACNQMHDLPDDDAQWFTKALPEGNYRSANDVLAALLTKV